MTEWWQIILIVAAGFLAGFINTLAGSGSLVTLPLMIFLGLPAQVANGTNRVAILLQNVVGVSRFHQKGALDFKRGVRFLVPICLGAIVGAQIAVDLNEKIMRLSIAIVMAIMLVVILVRPKKWLKGREFIEGSKPSWVEYVIFFVVGIYGGFIQAGVGIFLLSALVLGSGFDLVRANAVKVFLILVFTVFALVIFILHGQVDWPTGLVLALGNMAGAWVGAHAAVKNGAGFVRWVLILVVAISSLKLFWDVFAS